MSNGRPDYLRISVTDRCNLRCTYCLPRGMVNYKPPREILSFEEISRLVKILISTGIRKVRITGGEPLLRRGVIGLIRSLNALPGLEEVSLTTNGTLLKYYAGALKEAGIKRINISLDTLDKERFGKIAGIDLFDDVISGIDKSIKEGFSPVKLNVVVIKGLNDDEIIDFVEFSLRRRLILRFIEFMDITPLWDSEKVFSVEEIYKVCSAHYRLFNIGTRGPGPAAYYRVKDSIIGFIKRSDYNCLSCNRLRLTADGLLKLCLYEKDGLDVRGLLRNGLTDKDIQDIIEKRLLDKGAIPFYKDKRLSDTYMNTVGG